jgi:DNA-binding LacI/PurR family transcriptional regulator
MLVYQGLQRGGVRVPRDVALVGFDGLEEGQYLAGGPLTTVRAPVNELCRAAVEILMQRIGGDSEGPSRQVLVPMQLSVGATT